MTKYVRAKVEWPCGHAAEMIEWCKENRVPVIHCDLDPILSVCGIFIVGNRNVYRGTRGLYWQRQLASTGSCRVSEIDIEPFVFLIRESDFPLWKLRFTIPDDYMTLIEM